LFCNLLSTTTTGEDIFEMAESVLKVDELKWKLLSSVHFDGASALFTAHKGFLA
jgi:hypothetical protein